MSFWVSRILSELFKDEPREALKFLTSSVFTEKPYRPLDRLEACQMENKPGCAFDSCLKELKELKGVNTTHQYEGVKGVLEIFDSFDDEINKIYEIKLYETLKFLTSSVFYGEQYPRPIDRLEACKEDKLESCIEELKKVKTGLEWGEYL